MYNRNISAINFEHSNVPCSDRIGLIVGKEQQITAEESGLHRSCHRITLLFRPDAAKAPPLKIDVPESTTTIGLSDPVTTMRPFHIMRADEITIAKLRPCNWRTLTCTFEHSCALITMYNSLHIMIISPPNWESH